MSSVSSLKLFNHMINCNEIFMRVVPYKLFDEFCFGPCCIFVPSKTHIFHKSINKFVLFYCRPIKWDTVVDPQGYMFCFMYCFAIFY